MWMTQDKVSQRECYRGPQNCVVPVGNGKNTKTQPPRSPGRKTVPIPLTKESGKKTFRCKVVFVP